MQKAVIILIALCISGCKVLKTTSENNSLLIPENTKTLINEIESNNLINKSFYIKKGSIEIESKNDTRKILFSLKHSQSDTLLLILRSNMGIEAARIFMSSDTVLINDRINRRLISGKPLEVSKITGIPVFFKSLLLGDKLPGAYVINENLLVNDKKLYINQYKDGFLGKSEVDIKAGKIKNSIWNKGPGTKEIIIKYSNFDKQIHFPKTIKFQCDIDSLSMVIRISKIDMNYKEKIEFIPDAGYKHEELE